MGLFFIYVIMEQFAVGILRGIFKWKVVDYLPQEVTDNLIPQPYAQKILSSAAKINLWESKLVIYLAVAAVYILLYCFITNRRFTKSDL